MLGKGTLNLLGVKSLAFLCIQGTLRRLAPPVVLMFSCGAQGVAQE